MNLKIGIVQSYLLTLIILILIVSFIQYLILRPFEIGFSPDDWSFVFIYKSLGDNPILKLSEVWQERGPYTTFFLYYLGGLVDIWGINYQAIGLTNIIIKVVATVSIFPLIALVFKNKLFAALSVFLYAISYSSVGSLEFAVKGGDYVSIFFMNSFFISYFFLVKKNILKTKWLPISCILLLLTIISSTIRSYPLLFLIPLIELFIWTKQKNFSSVKIGIARISLLYLPLILALIYKPKLITQYFFGALGLYQIIMDGNWHLLLTPIQGLGFMFVPLEVWGHFIKPIIFEDLPRYIGSLILGGPILIWTIIVATLAITTSKKPLIFFVNVGVTNIVLQTVTYFIAFHSKNIPPNLQITFDPPRLYSTVNGVFATSLAIGYFKEWLSSTRNLIILASWVSLGVSFIFTILTWILADLNLGFKETSYYLVIASEGFAIFIAAILSLMLSKVYSFGKAFLIKKAITWLLVVLILTAIFFVDKQVVNSFFVSINSKGRSYIAQNLIQDRFRKHLKDIDLTRPALFYMDVSDITDDGTFFSETFLSIFPHRIHIMDNRLIDGCSEIFYEDKTKLVSFIRTQEGKKGILYRSLCVEDGKAWNQEMFYKKENIYAFKLKNRDFVDIREEIHKELGL
ncbi:MAG: hypothetical protein AAB414_02520 [Patescibacteria group bacterium]